MPREIDKSQSSVTIKLTRANVSQSSQVCHWQERLQCGDWKWCKKQREDERETRTRSRRIFRGATEHGDVRRVPKHGCQGPTDRADYVMWRNFEPQTQNKRREKNCVRTKATNQFAYIPVNRTGQWSTNSGKNCSRNEASETAKGRLGIRVNANADPMSKGLPHHLC